MGEASRCTADCSGGSVAIKESVVVSTDVPAGSRVWVASSAPEGTAKEFSCAAADELLE